MRGAAFGFLLALLAACASSGGTETGNPPTRGSCDGVECKPCPPPITLVLTDAAQGGPIAGAAVDRDATVCVVGEASTICALAGEPYSAVGLHEILIEASGYETVTAELELRASIPGQCCACGYSAVRKEFALVPSAR